MSPEDEMESLLRLGRDAPPAVVPAPHATDDELARMRAGDEAADLDDAYRHAASCAACRARLVEPAAEVARVKERSLGGPARVAPVVALRPRRAMLFGFAAAAALVLAIGVRAMVDRAPGPIAVTQRAYVGVMGEGDASALAVAPEDRDVELMLDGPADGAAALLVVDGAGHRLAPVRWFARTDARLVAVVAPRTFAAHTGDAFGLVVAGERNEQVEQAIARATASAVTSTDGVEGALRAQRGLRIQRVVIGARGDSPGVIGR
jgi:hypothetical protein